jgi:hypothetical protein
MGSRTKFLTLRVTGQRWYYERSGGGNTPSTPWRCESPGKRLLPGRARSLHIAPRERRLGWLQLVTALRTRRPSRGSGDRASTCGVERQTMRGAFESKVGRLNADHHRPVLRGSGSGSGSGAPPRHPNNCSDVTVRQ